MQKKHFGGQLKEIAEKMADKDLDTGISTSEVSEPGDSLSPEVSWTKILQSTWHQLFFFLHHSLMLEKWV